MPTRRVRQRRRLRAWEAWSRTATRVLLQCPPAASGGRRDPRTRCLPGRYLAVRDIDAPRRDRATYESRSQLLDTLAEAAESGRRLHEAVEALTGGRVDAAEHEAACLTALVGRAGSDRRGDADALCSAACSHLERLADLMRRAACMAADECVQVADLRSSAEEWHPAQPVSAVDAARLAARLRAAAR